MISGFIFALSFFFRIRIVAFGSALILACRRFARKRGRQGCRPKTCLRDFIPQTPFFASRRLKEDRA